MSGAQAAPQGELDPCAAVTCATLSVNGFGTGSGTVTSSPAGINCTVTAGVESGTCSKMFVGPLLGGFNNLVVDTTWVASPGSDVSGGMLAHVPSLTYGYNLADGQSAVIEATFTLKQFLLSVSRSGVGTGTVKSQPAGIDCGTSCSAQYDYGTHVTLTATPDAGAVFKQWTGACNGQGAVCDLTITAATSTNAVFDLASTGGGGGAEPPAGSPGEEADTVLDAELLSAKRGKSKLGKRVFRAEISADERISVLVELVRGGTVVASKRVSRFNEGTRLVVLGVPNAIKAGKATLRITLEDLAHNKATLTRSVRVQAL